MRQRVLLVAGWVLAAAVTSLVATAAVTVAGGRVTDRPLRPVAAPASPAANTNGGAAASEFRASGNCEVVTPFDETQVDGQQTDIPEGLAGDEADAGSGDQPSESIDSGLSGVESTQVREVATPGGTVVVRRTENTLTLISITVRPGYKACRAVADSAAAVTFTNVYASRGDDILVLARLSDGELAMTVVPGGTPGGGKLE